MAKRTLTMYLSEDSMKNAIKEIEEYENRIKRKTKLLAERLAENGVMFAKAEIVTLDAIFSGELKDSIIPQLLSETSNGSTWLMVANSEHAAFVEFGTGYVGWSNPYNGKFPEGLSWDYVVGKQIVANARKGIYGWWYEKNGQTWFTEGMASRPFMTNASISLMSKVIEIAKEVFNE